VHSVNTHSTVELIFKIYNTNPLFSTMRIPKKNNGAATIGGNQVATRPPIPLVAVEEGKVKSDEAMKFKLQSVPGKKDSPTFEVVVNPFRNGTPEEFIKTLIALDQVCKGQNLKEAKDKYVMARRVFLGETLTAFNNASAKVSSKADESDKGEESEDSFKLVLKEVSKAVFPLNAYALQKQAMRRFMRKPKDMKIRSYVERMLEINKYLEYFPVRTGEPDAVSMPSDDIMDILKFGIPNTWQNRMIELGFDTQASTTSEFIDLCQRISYGESNKEDGSMTKSKQIAGKEGAKLQPKKKPSPEANPKLPKWCPLHRTNGHDAKECKVILSQVKRMQSAYDAGGATNAKRQKKEYQSNKTEQMFSFMVNAFKEATKKEAPKSNDKKRKESNFAFDDEVFDEIKDSAEKDASDDDSIFNIDD
jgi:hypothetical protein